MTAKSKTPSKDNSFGSFAIGVAVGVGAALLFGTEDGRKLARNLFDSLPDKIKQLKDEVTPIHDPSSTIYDLPFSESTPHHTTYEAPPPPAPHVEPRLASL